MRCWTQTAIALLLAVGLLVVLVAPAYDLLPTTAGEKSTPQITMAAAVGLLPLTLIVLAFAAGPDIMPAFSSDLVTLTCTRIC